MEEQAKQDGVETWTLLNELGFVENPAEWSDYSTTALTFDFGNLKLNAGQFLSARTVRHVVLLSGVLSDGRSIAEVQCELPLNMESREQGIAWIVWCIDNACGRQFAAQRCPPWLEEGRKNRHLLPWERRMRAYTDRPQCVVDREWLRVGLKKLKEEMDRVADSTPVSFSFDGTILLIRCGEATLAMPAVGRGWSEAFITTAGTIVLPSRLGKAQLAISIWESKLVIGNRVCAQQSPSS